MPKSIFSRLHRNRKCMHT